MKHCIADVEKDVDMKKLKSEEAITILNDMKVKIPVQKATATQIKRNVALDMAISALEKQIPKKPGYTKLKYICNGKDIEINHPECPFCRTHGLTLWDAAIPVGDKFCKRCGQAIYFTEGEG